MENLILASSSPRRKELLENLQLSFIVSTSNADETFHPDLAPEEVVVELASRKARSAAENHPQSYVIGADTIVVFDGKILGKPSSPEEAKNMLMLLSNNIHSVYTGVAIVSPAGTAAFYEKTDVAFWELSEEEIDAYIKTGEPFDKAGAYGIQGIGSLLVREIRGDYFNVVGLPVARLIRELKKLGFPLPYGR